MTDPPRLHPLPEVAQRYQLPVRGLWDRAVRREFEHIRIGKQRFVTDEQLRALLDTYTVTSARKSALAATQDRATAARARSRRGRKQSTDLLQAA